MADLGAFKLRRGRRKGQGRGASEAPLNKALMGIQRKILGRETARKSFGNWDQRHPVCREGPRTGILQLKQGIKKPPVVWAVLLTGT